MSCEEQTATLLRDAGQKVTPQRMLILCAVRHSGDHVTVSEVLEDVRRSYPYIDASTVYRTLGSAREIGLVSEINLGSPDVRFEWIGQDPHHHLVCRVCGHEQSLDSDYLNDLANALLSDYEFEADIDHFAIPGRCGHCRRSREESP
jgi:Fur family transcriptional regulator, ferric uptake regulator